MKLALLLPLAAGGVLVATARPLDRIGQVLLLAGQPLAAASVFQDPDWKGAALYRARRWAAAADSFGQGRDPSATYNRGNALARLGAYAAAIEAYDRALARDPGHEDAKANRALLLALIRPTESGSSGATAGDGDEARRGAANPNRATAPDAPAPSAGDGLAGSREVALALGDTGGRAPGRAPRDSRALPEAGRRGGGSGDETARGGSRNVTPEAAAARRADAPAGRERAQATEQWIATIPDDPKRSLRIRIAAEARRRALAGAAPEPGGDPW